MAHGDVQQNIWQLWDAVRPDIEPSLLLLAELGYEHFPAREAADLIKDVRIHLGKIIVLASAQRPTRALNSMVTFAFKDLAAQLLGALGILAQAWRAGRVEAQPPAQGLCEARVREVHPIQGQRGHQTCPAVGPPALNRRMRSSVSNSA